jgi:hypothetical protein
VPTFRFLPKIHQHGPLFNYGPYYGYPPFEPYGYWNSYLQYTGPVPLPTTGHGGGAGATGWIHSPHPHTFGNGFPHPLHNGGLGHKHKGAGGGCSTCGQVAATYVNSGNALDRYTGVGTPAASAAVYAGSANAVITVGHTDR